jgi:hypothetical protein
MAIRAGGLILLAIAAAIILAAGLARRDMGPPLPVSLVDVVLPSPMPADSLNLPDKTPLLGRWTLVCAGAAMCRNAEAAIAEIPGNAYQVLPRASGDVRTMPLIDPRGRIYAHFDGTLPRLDLAGLVWETTRYFDREVLARLF